MNDCTDEFTLPYLNDWDAIALKPRPKRNKRISWILIELYYNKCGMESTSWIDKDAATRSHMLAYKRV